MGGGAEDDNNDNDHDAAELRLVQASGGLLSDLQRHLPRVLWRGGEDTLPPPPPPPPKAHTRVRKLDLERLVSLVEPFQGEPQLLDAKLGLLLPPIVDAYLQQLQLGLRDGKSSSRGHIDTQAAVCTLIYTFAKVRGYKIVAGFLNNEPRYLEPILEALERSFAHGTSQVQWQVPYVLLLWLWHLLLTPFDLTSISSKAASAENASDISHQLPSLTGRVLRVGLRYLDSPTKAQDAAAMMIVRLIRRPDVQKLGLADALVRERLPRLAETAPEMQGIYEMLGSLRMISGVSSSAELSHLVPAIYRTFEKSFDDRENFAVVSNAVAKKIVVKVFRNIAILALRSVSTDGPLQDFLQDSGVVENVIDYLLRSLANKDTPVRFAAAKAISLIVLELDPEMGHEVIQAVLEAFKEDMPRSAQALDFSTADPLKWHGLTLTLAHALFKRSASPEQLPDILNALIAALQFQQRTTTGSTLGTNVRDAANFGIWSLARRYTTAELLPVRMDHLHSSNQLGSSAPIIQVLAIQLILSACLDPSGNIRRGSSASLQELVGRHPDQIHHGISLVQVVDYQAVSRRQRAMVEAAAGAAGFHPTYWKALFNGLFAWRGLGSADVPSREGAATSIAKLATISRSDDDLDVLRVVNARVQACRSTDVEQLHGLTLTAAKVLANQHDGRSWSSDHPAEQWSTFKVLHPILKDFSPRMLRSEFPAALAQYTTTLCQFTIHAKPSPDHIPVKSVDSLVDALLYRREESILDAIPALVQALLRLKRVLNLPLACIGAQTLANRVKIDGAKSTLHSVGRAIALGTLAASYDQFAFGGEDASLAVLTLAGLMEAMNVDWRIVGANALRLVTEDIVERNIDPRIASTICMAVHQALNDYTIDERGDIGSLVRLQAVRCASEILRRFQTGRFKELIAILRADINRLSLEKLDRVRQAAAQLRTREFDLRIVVEDVGGVSTVEYFTAALEPLARERDSHIERGLLEGSISCAGIGNESLLQASRHALAATLTKMELPRLVELMTTYSTIMKDLLADTRNHNLLPALELLAFLLDIQIPQRLSASTFKWRNLLSTVQKSHHKSNDISKILAAVHVYVGLADVDAIRVEVMRKLLSMLKTNPYPRVRTAVAEALWIITKDEGLKGVDGTKPAAQNKEIAERLLVDHTAS